MNPYRTAETPIQTPQRLSRFRLWCLFVWQAITKREWKRAHFVYAANCVILHRDGWPGYSIACELNKPFDTSEAEPLREAIVTALHSGSDLFASWSPWPFWIEHWQLFHLLKDLDHACAVKRREKFQTGRAELVQKDVEEILERNRYWDSEAGKLKGGAK